MKIKKLGDNQVRVIKQKEIKDTDGKKVYIDDEPVEYGLKKVQYEKDAIQAQIDYWSAPVNVQAHIAQLQERLSDLDLIEQALNE